MCNAAGKAWQSVQGLLIQNLLNVAGSETLVSSMAQQLQVAVTDHGSGLSGGEKVDISSVLVYASTVKDFIQRAVLYLESGGVSESIIGLTIAYSNIELQTQSLWKAALDWCESECYGACKCR